MNYKQASKILTQAINYNEDGSTRNGNWILGADGIEAIKTAIIALNKVEDIKSKKIKTRKKHRLI